MYEKIKSYWQSEKRNIIFCFAATFILGLAAHAYIMFNNAMSHDWLNAFVATDSETVAKIGVGRYIVPLYRIIFRNSIALPWLIGFMSLFWFSLSTYLITKIFEIHSRLLLVLSAGVIVTNISVTAQFATYLHEADCNALSLFLSVAAVYIWKNHTKIYHLLASALLLFLSIGIYQSYICVAITLIICISILRLFNMEDIKKVITNGICGICVIITGFLLYYFIGLAVHHFTGITAVSRVNFFQVFSSGNSFIKIIVETYLFFARMLFHPTYKKELLLVIFSIIFLVIAFVALRTFIKQKFDIPRIVLISLLVISLPFGMCAIYIITYGIQIHDLMIYAVWITLIMVLVLVYRFLTIGTKKLYRIIINGIIFSSVFIIIWQNVIIANTVYIKKELVAESSFSTMTRVLDRIEQHSDYIPGETPIAFIGVTDDNSVSSPYNDIDDFVDVNCIIGVDMNNVFSLDVIRTTYNSYEAYFKYVLNNNAVFCDKNTHVKLKQNKTVENMPFFPAEDSVQMVDGVIVVKLGNIILW